MSQGSAPRQADLFRDTSSVVEPLVRSDSIHALLARECRALFPDALFDDLFAANVGRRSVPPLVVAVVMAWGSETPIHAQISPVRSADVVRRLPAHPHPRRPLHADQQA